MADIFVSYAREDYNKAAPFVALLEEQGWTVWWDRDLTPGASFSKVIEQEIRQARCIVVLWSQKSVSSDWVQAEANEGLERKILVPISLEDTSLPLIFKQKQSADFSRWPNGIDTSTLEQVIEAISNVIERPVTTEIRKPKNKKLSLGLMLAVAAVTLTSAAFLLLVDTDEHQTEVTSIVEAANPLRPVASISVSPFDTQAIDLSPEVAENLAKIPLIQVISADGNSTNTARYSLKGVQVNEKLLVSLFDEVEKHTQLDFEIDLSRTSLSEATQQIVKTITREFNQSFTASRNQIPDEVYVEYLAARSSLREVLTDESLDSTIILFDDLISKAPRFAEAQAGLCRAHINRYLSKGEAEDFENAEKHCFRANRLSTNDPYVHIALGELYSAAGQWDEATLSFNEALSISPFLTEALRGLGVVRFRQSKSDEAISYFKTAQEYEPRNWRNYSKLGEQLFRLGEYEAAAREYLIAKDLVVDQSNITNDLGATYFMLEDFEEAVSHWEMSLRLDPSYSAYSNLGSAYYFNGNYTKALENYEAAIELNAGDYRMWMNAGEAALHSGNDYQRYYLQALAQSEEQLAINPDDPEIISAAAQSLASLGNEAGAMQKVEEALKLGSDNVYVLYDVGVAYARLGKTDLMSSLIRKMEEKGYSSTLIERDANFK